MKKLTIAALAMFALAFLFSAASAADLKVGDPAPDFELKGSDGKLHSLKELKGKKAIVIAWYPAAFTGGCTKECKSMKEDGEAIRKFDVAYFTASTDPMDGPRGNKAFAESLGVDYPILSDPEGKTAKDFGVVGGGGRARRWTFFISKDGKILEIDKEVDSKLRSTEKTYGATVAAKLKELGVAEKK